VPAGRFNEFPEVFKDPQVVHREMVVTVPHPEKSDLRLVSRAAKMSDSKANYRPPPLLGEHTVSVLRDLLGKSEDEIEKLRRSGAI
jgi:crotonobetainyl-CoA:carnitine CoA-transferase CaiB-like acyl-CoA transferase